MKPRKVVVRVVRHGQKKGALGKLTEKGRQQSLAFGKKLAQEFKGRKTPAVIKFYSSPVDRAQATMRGAQEAFRRNIVKDNLNVKIFNPRVQSILHHSKIWDMNALKPFLELSSAEFERKWLRNQVPANVMEPPAEVILRILKRAVKIPSKLSKRLKGKGPEVNLAFFTHADLAETLVEHITGKKFRHPSYAKETEQVKIVIQGSKGTIHFRKRKPVSFNVGEILK